MSTGTPGDENGVAFTVLSMCSGIGGLELGLAAARADARVICWIERNSAAAACLLARMEDQSLEAAPIWCGDLADVDYAAFTGRVSCITAGFPCQPWSIAGPGKGLEDERHIFGDICNAISVVGPGQVFLENVPGLLATGLGHVLGPLAEMGYDAVWGSFRASSWAGASHRRERVFILANARDRQLQEQGRGPQERGGTGSAGPTLAHAKGKCKRKQDDSECSESRQNPRQDVSRGSGELADASSERGKRQGDARDVGGAGDEVEGEAQQLEWRRETADGCGVSVPLFAPGPRDSRWPTLLGSHPSFEPAVRRATNGHAAQLDLSRTDRLTALGNGVVPAQAALAYIELNRRLNG